MTEIAVTPEELSSVANTLEGYVSQLQSIAQQVQSTQLPAGAFGQIPGLSSHMDQTYSQHVQQSTQVLTIGTQGLDSVEKSLLATSNGMLEMEQNHADGIKQCIPD